MGVYFVLLALGASFDVFLYVFGQLGPPVVFSHQFFCLVDAWMSIGRYVMVSPDDLAFVLSCSCDYFARVLPPFPVYLLEVMGSCSLFYYSFVLLRRFLGYVG